jgi:hypothetical protein
MPYLHPDVMDNGLVTLTNATSKVLHITHTEATTRANAISASVGNKSAPTVGSPAAGAGAGRKVTISAITDGAVTATSTGASDDAQFWAVIDGSRLLAAGTLSAAQMVTNGNTFTLGAFDISINAPA